MKHSTRLFMNHSILLFKSMFIIAAVLKSHASVHAQTFNVLPQANVSGMPGGLYNDIWGYVDKQGKEYAIIGSSQAINIYDVTDCKNPIQKWSYQDGTTEKWRDFKTYRNYAYAVCDGGGCTEGLEIINLDNYSFSQNTSTFTVAHNIYIDTTEARLYVVGSNKTDGELLIYTLDTEVVNGITYSGTPANPLLVSVFNTNYIHDIYVVNNIAYASQGFSGLKIFDVSDPANIIVMSSINGSSGYNHSSWVTTDGAYAYVAEELPIGRPMRIYELTGGSTGIAHIGNFNEALEAPFDSNNRPHNPFIVGNHLHISYYVDGAQIYDISDRTQPKRIAYYDTYTAHNGSGYFDSGTHQWNGQWGSYPFLPSGCLLASDMSSGLHTYKLDLPVSDGATLGVINRSIGDVYISTSTKGVVLRSPSGYCYRVKTNSVGTQITERINCYINNQVDTRMYKSDLAFTLDTQGVVFKNSAGNCHRLAINDDGSLKTNSTSCPTTSNNTSFNNTDLFIETYTKGIIMKSNHHLCYRVTVDDSGVLIKTLLNACP